MNPVSTREARRAALALAGVALLGVAIGVIGNDSTPYDASAASGRGALIPMSPEMARLIDAKPIAPDALPSSSAPTALAQASAKTKDVPDSDAEADNDEARPNAREPAPPALYAPPAPEPAAGPSKSAEDANLPPY